MPTALFYNFSEHEFVGTWGGKSRAFPAGSKTYMPAFLAQHFAKHLTNRELHRKGLDNATSPKFPEQVPEFNEMFRKAYVRDRDMEAKRNDLDAMIDAVNLNRQPEATSSTTTVATPQTSSSGPATITAPTSTADELDVSNPEPQHTGPGTGAQIISSPDDDEEFEDNEPIKS